MGLLTGKKTVETRAVGDSFSDDLLSALGVAKSATGEDITARNSLEATPVWDAVRQISETIASLPLILFRRLENGGKERATDHRFYRTLHKAPNPWMTKFQFVETLQSHLLTWGNAYANIETLSNGDINLWPLQPDRVDVRIKNKQITYKVRMSGEPDRTVQPENMFHVRGMSWNGIQGISPIKKNADSIGLTKAAEEFGASYFRGDGMPRGALSHPEELSEKGRQNLKTEWENAYGGMENTHRVAILEENMSWEQIGVPPEDSQLIESREFQVVDVARIFNIQPHKLKTLENSNFATIEQQDLEYVKHTLRPWLVRWEEEIERSLIPPDEQPQIFAEHVVEGILRADIESRYKAYDTAIRTGFMNRNEVRIKENMNPQDGLDTFLFPANQIQVGEDGEGILPEQPNQARSLDDGRIEERQEEGPNLESARTRSKIARDAEPVFEDAAGRIIRREAADIMEMIERHLPQGDIQAFDAELNNFLFDDHVDFVAQQFRPPQEALAAQIVRQLENEIDINADNFGISELISRLSQERARIHAEISAMKMAVELDEAQSQDQVLAERAEGVIEEWREDRPEKMAREEAHETGNKAAMAAFATAGVGSKRWMAVGENCPNCDALDGSLVAVDAEFVPSGESFGPRDFTPSSDVQSPPLHGTCDCVLVPA